MWISLVGGGQAPGVMDRSVGPGVLVSMGVFLNPVPHLYRRSTSGAGSAQYLLPGLPVTWGACSSGLEAAAHGVAGIVDGRYQVPAVHRSWQLRWALLQPVTTCYNLLGEVVTSCKSFVSPNLLFLLQPLQP